MCYFSLKFPFIGLLTLYLPILHMDLSTIPTVKSLFNSLEPKTRCVSDVLIFVPVGYYGHYGVAHIFLLLRYAAIGHLRLFLPLFMLFNFICWKIIHHRMLFFSVRHFKAYNALGFRCFYFFLFSLFIKNLHT